MHIGIGSEFGACGLPSGAIFSRREKLTGDILVNGGREIASAKARNHCDDFSER
jgi:hypothetical protein